jgi:ubiquinone/menaquinone biosynthesis C-methylase UbiE
MAKGPYSDNLLFQSEKHPLVALDFETEEQYCLGLIHRKAYERARTMAKGQDVLDIGCNNGYGTKIISKNCASIIGVDVSDQAVAEAQRTYATGDLQFRVISGLSLPFEDQTFDLITSFQVIEHVADVEEYLSEIKRVLKTGGKVVFTTPNAEVRLDPGTKPWNPFHVREYSPEELKKLLSTVFTDVAVEGLFAEPAFYEIEYNRVQAARHLARRSKVSIRHPFRALKILAHRQLIVVVKAVLPQSTVQRLRDFVRQFPNGNGERSSEKSAGVSSTDRSFIQRWSLDDLFYSADTLERALDLIAICRKSDQT